MEMNTDNSCDNQDSLKRFIVETIQNEKPQTTKQLIDIVKKQTTFSVSEITQTIIDLEKMGTVKFSSESLSVPTSALGYIFSRAGIWYLLTLIISVLTSLLVFLIPETLVPLVYLRYALVFLFLLFLPGYCLIKIIFPDTSPMKSNNKGIDTIERIGLSIFMSLALVSLIGLILAYIKALDLLPIILCSMISSLFISTIAVLHEYRSKRPLNN